MWLNIFLLLIYGLIIFIAGLEADFEYDLKKTIVCLRVGWRAFWSVDEIPESEVRSGQAGTRLTPILTT